MISDFVGEAHKIKIQHNTDYVVLPPIMAVFFMPEFIESSAYFPYGGGVQCRWKLCIFL